MKNQFKNYLTIWAITFVIFNTITFVIPDSSGNKYEGAFWVGYVFIILTFLGNLLAGFHFFKYENKEKAFLNFPVLVISQRCLILTVIVGSIIMAVPGIPKWLGVIAAILILGFYAISAVQAKAAAEAVDNIGKKVAAETNFIKTLTVKAETALSAAKSDEAKEIAEKVFEAVRYSNKSSHGGLEEVESRISANFTVFSDAIYSKDDATAKSIGEKLLNLLTERNNIAKMIK